MPKFLALLLHGAKGDNDIPQTNQIAGAVKIDVKSKLHLRYWGSKLFKKWASHVKKSSATDTPIPA
jgi:hypothetical protein